MNPWALLWGGWLLAFLIMEGVALLNRREGDTLSEQFWRAFRVHDKRPTPLVIAGRVILALFGVWLTIHMVFGTMTLSHPLPW